jgi:hypothetical protein
MTAKKRRIHRPVPEPLPEWVKRYSDLHSQHVTGPYHLKRRRYWYATLCGVALHEWRRWPAPDWSRPDIDDSCGRCMRIATAHILAGRYERA